MANDKELALYVAVYDSVEGALSDLDAIEEIHKEKLLGTYDAAVVEHKGGKAHIVKRMDRPRVRVIPEVFGFGPLRRKELKEAADELADNEAGLIVVGEPTIEKGFDEAVTRAAKILKRTVNATTDEIAREMKEAVGD